MTKRVLLFAVICGIALTASTAFAKGQDIIKMNRNIEISKDMVVNDVVAIGGDVTVYGRVENNVVAVAGSVTLKDGSTVGGEVVAVGGEVLKNPNAFVKEKITQIYLPNFIPCLTNFLRGKWIILWTTISLLALMGFLGLAVLLVALAPTHISAVVNILERSFAGMLLWGFLWAILVVPITVLLAISIIGIILIPLEIVVIAMALITGYIAAAIFIGRKILSAFNKKYRLPFLDVILGILILFITGFAPILGVAVKIIFLMAGFGAVLITRFGTTK